MISGLQKMTLLDFPGKVACTVFLQGCNLRCPFCHNSQLLGGGQEPLMEEEEFFQFLKSRRGLLDGVCVSGGEPTLQSRLPDFLAKIKQLGFAVKLDTNGTRPEVLKSLMQAQLVDYVAMDVKNGPEHYPQTVAVEALQLSRIEQSLRLLICGNVDYELRTTLVEPLHNEASIAQMGPWLSSLAEGKKPRQLFLQTFVDRDTVLYSGLSAPEAQKVEKYAAMLTPYVEKVTIRKQ